MDASPGHCAPPDLGHNDRLLVAYAVPDAQHAAIVCSPRIPGGRPFIGVPGSMPSVNLFRQLSLSQFDHPRCGGPEPLTPGSVPDARDARPKSAGEIG